MPHLLDLPAEIFEAVLLQLPEDTLLGLQHLHSAFRNAVNSSYALKRKLWIAAPLDIDLSPITRGDPVEINPILSDIKCLTVLDQASCYDREGYETDRFHFEMSVPPGEATPWLAVDFMTLSKGEYDADYEEDAILYKRWYLARRLLSTGSQNYMQLVRPALPVQVKIFVDVESNLTVHLPAGATLGRVLYCVRQLAETFEWEQYFWKMLGARGLVERRVPPTPPLYTEVLFGR